jgi:hypothetical protein
MRSDIERYIAVSARVDTTDINWDEARAAGLSPDEVFVLNYFSNVENQTLVYMQSLLQMKIALQPGVAAFLTTWNYEEFFHGYELGRLLEVCGHSPNNRRQENADRSRLAERFEMFMTPILSRIFSNQFPAVYLAFGAIQELTTVNGYEHLRQVTGNPVLKILCERIVKQERRHFAWYFNHARDLLEASRGARRLTRRLMQYGWMPVGAGFHSPEEVRRLFTSIFYPVENARKMVRSVDAKISTLPGLEGIRLMEPYFEKVGLI